MAAGSDPLGLTRLPNPAAGLGGELLVAAVFASALLVGRSGAGAAGGGEP